MQHELTRKRDLFFIVEDKKRIAEMVYDDAGPKKMIIDTH